MALRRSRAFKATPDLWLYLQKAVDSGKRGKGLGDYVESAPCLHRAISDVHFGCSPPDSAQIPGYEKSPLPLDKETDLSSICMEPATGLEPATC